MSLKSPIYELEGMLPSHVSVLKSYGIRTLKNLLDKTPYPQDRDFLASQTGLDVDDIYYYANMSDLMRVKGIGKEFSELLAHSGVRNIQTLAQQNAEELMQKSAQLNAIKKYAGRDPKMDEIQSWITQANGLDIRLHDQDPAGYVSHFHAAGATTATKKQTQKCSGTCSTKTCCKNKNESNCSPEIWWKFALGILGLISGLWHFFGDASCWPILRWVVALFSLVLLYHLFRYVTTDSKSARNDAGNACVVMAILIFLSCLACFFHGRNAVTNDLPPLAVRSGAEESIQPQLDEAMKEIETNRRAIAEDINTFVAAPEANADTITVMKQEASSAINSIKGESFAQIKALRESTIGNLANIKTGAINSMKDIGIRYLNMMENETGFYSDIADNSPLYEAIAFLKGKALMPGYDDNTFRADASLTRSDLVDLLLGMKQVDTTILTESNCYPDVSTQANASSVCYASEKGWVNGYDDGTFRPLDTVTRAEALKMIMNIVSSEEPKETTTNPYPDVMADAWYAKYVNAAKEANLLGDITTFEPANDMTRGDIATIVYEALQ